MFNWQKKMDHLSRCSVALLCPTLCNPMNCSTPGLRVPHYLPKFAQVHVHSIVNAIQPSHFLMPSYPFAFSLTQHQGLFQWVSFSHQVTKILAVQHLFFQWVFRVDFPWDWLVWFLVVQGTFKSLLQHHSSKASIFWCSAYFMAQLSQPYRTTGKTTALTIRTFVSRGMSLLFSTLSRFDVAPAKKQSSSDFMAAVTIHSNLRDKKMESVTASTFIPSICHE